MTVKNIKEAKERLQIVSTLINVETEKLKEIQQEKIYQDKLDELVKFDMEIDQLTKEIEAIREELSFM